MSIELKIKSKHLGLEAKVIKFEEAKLKRQRKWLANHQKSTNLVESQFSKLTNHRKFDVRNENRATFLARAFIDGRPYKTVERSRKECDEAKFLYYVLPKVLRMLQTYSSSTIMTLDIRNWMNQPID